MLSFGCVRSNSVIGPGLMRSVPSVCCLTSFLIQTSCYTKFPALHTTVGGSLSDRTKDDGGASLQALYNDSAGDSGTTVVSERPKIIRRRRETILGQWCAFARSD